MTFLPYALVLPCMCFGGRNDDAHTHESYNSAHPCYYKFGGLVLFPSEIKSSVDLESYPDLMVEEILAASSMAEPKRSERLRGLRQAMRQELSRNLAIYLDRVRALKARRLDPDPPAQHVSSCVYVAMSLKHNHIYNDYARLMICEQHLSKQRDFFS